MSDSNAQAGVIASQAGATAGHTGAQDSANPTADVAKPGLEAGDSAGKLEVTEGEKPLQTDEKAPKMDAKAAKTSETTKKVVQKTKELVDTVLDEAANAQDAGDTIKIKVLKAHPSLGAFAGDTTTLPADVAEGLIESGHVVQVSADGKALAPTYGQPTGAQLAAGKAAFDRFRAVAIAEEEEEEDLVPSEGQFSDLPASIQRAFVAAVDPTYGPQA